jgi:ketosteroid isomerase-like protein
MHGNVAWAVYPYSATYKTKNGEYTTVGYATMVLTKDTGKWLITHYHISGEAQTPKVAQAPTTP